MNSSSVEKFPNSDLSTLKDELMQSGLDSWHAAELISSFLVARGYGGSNADDAGTTGKARFRHVRDTLRPP